MVAPPPKRPEIHLAPSFAEDVESVRRELDGEAALAALHRVILELDTFDWSSSVPPNVYSAYGQSLSYRFHPRYVFTLTVKKSAARTIIQLRRIQRG